MSPERSRLAGAVLVTVALVGAVGLYLVRGGPPAPDFGLQQIDIITLDERVDGVTAEGGRPTLVVLAGPPAARRCAEQLRLLAAGRASGDGIGSDYGVVVVTPDGTGPAVPSARYLADPSGALARAVALPDAGPRCRPGYVVVDAGGSVRYRSYDPAYGDHAFEQRVLLDAVR